MFKVYISSFSLVLIICVLRICVSVSQVASLVYENVIQILHFCLLYIIYIEVLG